MKGLVADDGRYGIKRALIALAFFLLVLPAQAVRADEYRKRALAAEAALVMGPVLLEVMEKGFMDSFERNHVATEVGRCPAALAKLREGMREKALPLLEDAVRGEDTRRQLIDALAAIYSMEQLQDFVARRPIRADEATRQRIEAEVGAIHDGIMSRLAASEQLASLLASLSLGVLPEVTRCQQSKPASAVGTRRAASELALRAYLKVEPEARKLLEAGMVQGMVASLERGQTRNAATDCPPSTAAFKESVVSLMVPRYVDLFLSPPSRELMAAEFDAIYTVAQLEELARGSNPRTTPAQGRAMQQALDKLFLDLSGRAASDPGMKEAMAGAMAMALEETGKCLDQEHRNPEMEAGAK